MLGGGSGDIDPPAEHAIKNIRVIEINTQIVDF
jgi:hypothetical protein